LQSLSEDRLEDAKALYKEGRYDGAFYISGYALELVLKKRISQTLGWSGYPNTKKEFENLGSFKVHNIEMLLHLSGVEGRIKSQFWKEWSMVIAWDPEIRYSSKKQNAQDVETMLKNVESGD
jgi:HEPN domain-containing protein